MAPERARALLKEQPETAREMHGMEMMFYGLVALMGVVFFI